MHIQIHIRLHIRIHIRIYMHMHIQIQIQTYTCTYNNKRCNMFTDATHILRLNSGGGDGSGESANGGSCDSLYDAR